MRHEKYLLFRNDNEESAACMLLNVIYDAKIGKTFTVISESGSPLLRKQVLGRVVEEQKRLSSPNMRQETYVTSTNYTFKNRANDGGYLRFDIIPKKNSQYLLDGQAWFDTHTYQLIKISGLEARSPSMWSGKSTITRSYGVHLGGYTLADYLEATSHNLLFGVTSVKIEYTNYSSPTEPLVKDGDSNPSQDRCP